MLTPYRKLFQRPHDIMRPDMAYKLRHGECKDLVASSNRVVRGRIVMPWSDSSFSVSGRVSTQR